MSLFPILVSIDMCIKKLQRDFLWGGLEDDHKFCLVNLKAVCKPIQFGGLGVRSLLSFNKALLGKWLWNYAKEKGVL